VDLVIENAMRYNKPGTPYYKAAQRIKSNSATALAELNNLRTSAPSELISDNGMVANATIGDLEPPFVLLDLLVSPDIADELNIVLHSNPLQFLLAYELPEAKPPPPLPLQPTLHPRKNKRERKAETGKRRTEQRAALVPPATFSAQADSEMVDASSFDPHTHIPTHSPAKVIGKDPVPAKIEVTTGASSGLRDGPEAEQILGKRKRAKPAHPHPSTDAEVLTDINPKASFALFDKGWILDPGVRRGGRARTDRPPPPLMKKRSKGECICHDCVIHSREVSLYAPCSH
jgi:NuA3 HAT complex component NTO1